MCTEQEWQLILLPDSLEALIKVYFNSQSAENGPVSLGSTIKLWLIIIICFYRVWIFWFPYYHSAFYEWWCVFYFLWNYNHKYLFMVGQRYLYVCKWIFIFIMGCFTEKLSPTNNVQAHPAPKSSTYRPITKSISDNGTCGFRSSSSSTLPTSSSAQPISHNRNIHQSGSSTPDMWDIVPSLSHTHC